MTLPKGFWRVKLKSVRKRYIGFEVVCGEKLKRKDFSKVLWKESLAFLGEMLTSRSGMWLLHFKDNKGILKCNVGYVDEVICSLASITQVNGKRANVLIFGVSGTIKSIKEMISW